MPVPDCGFTKNPKHVNLFWTTKGNICQ